MKKNRVSSINDLFSQEGFITSRGKKVWYQIIGAESQGIPLLTLHGGSGCPHDYLEPIARLGNERPVIFYDQLGCGQSDRTQDPSFWTLEYFVEELKLVRHSLKLDQVHILGQSWGSTLAVEYFLTTHLQGIHSFIFSGPCISAVRFANDQRNYLNFLPHSISQTIIECESKGLFDSPEYQEAMMEFYNRHVCRLEVWPDCLNRSLENVSLEIYQYMWGPSEFTVTGTLKNFDRVDSLHQINVPSLFTCGEFDEATPETTTLYHRKLPGSKLVIFEGTSHSHHLEKTEEYLQVVRGFLYQVD